MGASPLTSSLPTTIVELKHLVKGLKKTFIKLLVYIYKNAQL
jgi:hypothetical protein